MIVSEPLVSRTRRSAEGNPAGLYLVLLSRSVASYLGEALEPFHHMKARRTNDQQHPSSSGSRGIRAAPRGRPSPSANKPNFNSRAHARPAGSRARAPRARRAGAERVNAGLDPTFFRALFLPLSPFLCGSWMWMLSERRGFYEILARCSAARREVWLFA